MAALALRVELQQLSRHVGHRLLDARLGPLPGLGAELVELWRGAGVGRAILLNQVEPGERNVELCLVRELQNHQLERRLVVLLDDAKAAIPRDPMFHVDDVIANRQVAKIGDKCGRFRLTPGYGARLDVSIVD